MEFDKEQQVEARELYNKLINLYGEKAKHEALKKDRENTLKEDIASVCDIVNGDGIPQGNKVKMPLVQSIINQLFRNKPNKKDEEYGTLEMYRSAIKNKEVSQDLIDGYLAVDDLLDENKQNIKEAFKETSLLSKEVLSAIDMIVKDKYKEMKDEELEKAGFEVSVPKDKSDIYELRQSLEEFLNDGKK